MSIPRLIQRSLSLVYEMMSRWQGTLDGVISKNSISAFR